MNKKWQISEEEFKAITDAIESELGYCGSWGMTDVIECRTKGGRAVSMRVDVFLDGLKRNFIIKGLDE
jgi:hypothetical protein